jgi:hypothetical protein
MNAFLTELIMNLEYFLVSHLGTKVVVELSNEIYYRTCNIKVLFVTFLKYLPDDFDSNQFLRRNIDDKIDLSDLIIHCVDLRSDMHEVFLLIDLQEHGLNAFKARFHNGAECSRFLSLANLGLKEVLNQIVAHSCSLRKKALEPFKEVLLIGSYFAIGDQNVPNKV